MSATEHFRFDIDALRERAGATTFSRGEEYHRDGLVKLVVVEPKRVLAEVAGSEDYRTVLTGRGARVGGECSCPAFEDRGFCKHMVAAALTANAAGGDAEDEGAATIARIREHLKNKGVDALVQMIMDLAEYDDALLRRLDLASATMGAKGEKLAHVCARPSTRRPIPAAMSIIRPHPTGSAASTRCSTLWKNSRRALRQSWCSNSPSGRLTGSRRRSEASTIPTAIA